MNRAIYLCKPSGVMVGAIGGVDENTAALKQSVTDVWELSFDVQRYMERDGKLVESDYYLSLNEMMELYLPMDEDGIYFQIDAEPQISGDGVCEKKSVVAHSIECELQTKFLRNFKVNTGLDDSLENLVGYYTDDGTFVKLNINPYTNLPIDYIVVKNDYALRMYEAWNYLNDKDLNVNSSNGLVGNTGLYPYLLGLYEKYPRISANVFRSSDGTIGCDSYLRVIRSNDAGYVGVAGYDYNVRIGNDSQSSTHTKQFLMNGLLSLKSFYDEYGKQLSLVDLALEKSEAAGWGTGSIPDDMKEKKLSFNIDVQDVLSFFKSNCVTAMKVLFTFDRMDRTVGIEDVENDDLKHDTGVFMSFRDLVNSVDVKTSSQDGIRTRFYPTGANGLGITYANFGEDYIDDLSWFMNKVNEYGEYQYVSEGLRERYNEWLDYRNDEPCTYMGLNFANRREAFRELSRMYNQSILGMSEVMNKLPNDGCEIDYATFTFEELNIAYKAYVNAMSTLVTLYMSDVGAQTFDQRTLVARDAAGNICTSIKDTFYWSDFICYRDTIIPNVMKALVIYVNTKGVDVLDSSDPDQYDAATGEWKEWEGGNPLYNSNPKVVTENMSEAFLYDMSLYGMGELMGKQKAWRECASTLYKPGYVLSNGAVVDPIPASGYTYNTPDATGWSKLNETQRKEFTGVENFSKLLNEYLDYVSSTVRTNSLTKGSTKGVIAMAQDAIDALQPTVDALVSKQTQIQDARKQVASDVAMSSWPEFTGDDIRLINELIREGDYNNSNIVTTSLDDVVSTVDVQEELYQDAVLALSEKSRPQLSFEIGTDNLFAIGDFESLVESIKLLNFVRISIGLYKDSFEKLRIVGIERNPLISTDSLTLSFSNMTYSLRGVSDLACLFDSNMGGGSSSGGGGTSRGGTYGDNDADVQLSNNMLNALLRSKTATVGIAQILIDQLSNDPNAKRLIVQTGIFNNLQTGDISVSGDCITDHIKSSNYNASTGVGSYLALKDGKFTYADGKLTWDGSTLYIDGSVKIGSRKGDEIGKQYAEAYAPTTSNYPANNWTTEDLKQLHEGEMFNDISTGKLYVWTRISDGSLILFDKQSSTENSWDYVEIYYYSSSDSKYYKSDRLTGANISGAYVFVPAATFYVYFYTDGSVVNWGYRIDSVVRRTMGVKSFTSVSSLPRSVTSTHTLSSLPESPHNYSNNTQTLAQVNTGFSISSNISWGWMEMSDAEVAAALTRVSFEVDQVNGKITSEVTRALNAEESLNSRITQTAGSLSSEISDERRRADGVEQSLSSRITQTANDITSEVRRAQNAETELDSRVRQTASDITAEVRRAQNEESTIKQTADSVTAKVSSMDNGNYVASLINQTATTITIQANKINLSIGGANNAKGALYVTDYYGTTIGRWDKDGIYAAGGTFDGQMQSSGGKNIFYADGRFRIGNGALVYDPSTYGDNNIHLGNNMSLIYNGSSLVYEDVSSSVGCGYQYGSNANYYYVSSDITSTYYPGYSSWSYSFYKTGLKVYRSAQMVTVYFKFWATSQCNKYSIMLPGLPLSLLDGVPIEIKKLSASSGNLENTGKMAYLYNNGSRFAYLKLDSSLGAFTSSDNGFWIIYFTYVPNSR